MILTNRNDDRRPLEVEHKTTLTAMSKAASLHVTAYGAPVSARAIRLRLIAKTCYVQRATRRTTGIMSTQVGSIASKWVQNRGLNSCFDHSTFSWAG